MFELFGNYKCNKSADANQKKQMLKLFVCDTLCVCLRNSMKLYYAAKSEHTHYTLTIVLWNTKADDWWTLWVSEVKPKRVQCHKKWNVVHEIEENTTITIICGRWWSQWCACDIKQTAQHHLTQWG